jgi:hypothetical protein
MREALGLEEGRFADLMASNASTIQTLATGNFKYTAWTLSQISFFAIIDRTNANTMLAHGKEGGEAEGRKGMVLVNGI